MYRTLILAAAAMFLTASPSLAFHCPADAAAIDAALAKVSISESVRAQVTALRDAGMVEHGAGDHVASVNTLADAMRKLLTAL